MKDGCASIASYQYRLRWFQSGRPKLDKDLKFSENILNKCTYRIAKSEKNGLFCFHGIKSAKFALAQMGVWKNGGQSREL